MNKNVKTERIADGVDYCYIKSDRFKSARISVSAYMPMREDTVAAYSLLSLLLSGGCADYPSPRDLSCRLDTLYGASMGADSTKLGDILVLRSGIIFVDDRFLPENVFGDCAELLCKMIFEPAVDEGGFLSENFEREKRIQLEDIDGIINDKRAFARNRCAEIMCEGEPYGLPTLGTKEAVTALTRSEVYAAWKTMIKSAHFRIAVTACDEHPEVAEMFVRKFAAAKREDIFEPKNSIYHKASPTVKTVTERFPVAQGKLVMGFATDIAGDDSETYKMMVFSDVFGGGPYSLLFSNVREKMSLCYYCASSAVRKKGILMVDSGVEFANMEKTEKAVLGELQKLKDGDFDSSIIDASKLALIGALHGVYDSQAVLDRWYSDRLFDKRTLSPDEMADLIATVTKEDIVAAANGVRLDTVYCLRGEEN